MTKKEALEQLRQYKITAEAAIEKIEALTMELEQQKAIMKNTESHNRRLRLEVKRYQKVNESVAKENARLTSAMNHNQKGG